VDPWLSSLYFSTVDVIAFWFQAHSAALNRPHFSVSSPTNRIEDQQGIPAAQGMAGFTPLDATRHHSIVREHANDIHNINFTVAQALQMSSNLCSEQGASLQENDRSQIKTVMVQTKQNFEKFRTKYQPMTPARDEKVLTSQEAYWVFFALSGSDFDKSVKMADEMTKSLEQVEDIVKFLEWKQRNTGAC